MNTKLTEILFLLEDEATIRIVDLHGEELARGTKYSKSILAYSEAQVLKIKSLAPDTISLTLI